jgi:hypothetical protein
MQPSRLMLDQPKDGAAVSPHPKFVLRTDAENVSKLRFRIELSRDEFKTVAYTFDQLKEANGWAFVEAEGERQGAMYFVRKKLDGGDYEWRVSSWDGLSWQVGPNVARLTIDDVPPAEVSGVRIRRDPSTGCIRIAWDAVTTDRNGGVERVARYHVFRYSQRAAVPSSGRFEAGSTPETSYVDCDPETIKKPMVFYRVEAEDEVGNVFGRRIW